MKKKFPQLRQNYFFISPWFRFKMIFTDLFNKPLINLNYDQISCHNSITPSIIEQNPFFEWDFEALSYNQNITIDFIKKYKHREWDWDRLTTNPGISYNDIITNLDLPFNTELLKFNTGLSENEIKEYGYYENAYINPNVSMSFLIKHKSCINYSWFEWHEAGRKKKDVSYDLILNNPSFDWNCALENANIDPEVILSWHHISFDYEALSGNPNLRIKTVLQHININWNWDYISRNIKHVEDIEKYIELPWNWDEISLNKNITPDFVKHNSSRINFTLLSCNPLDGDYWINRVNWSNKRYQIIKYRLIVRKNLGYRSM